MITTVKNKNTAYSARRYDNIANGDWQYTWHVWSSSDFNDADDDLAIADIDFNNQPTCNSTIHLKFKRKTNPNEYFILECVIWQSEYCIDTKQLEIKVTDEISVTTCSPGLYKYDSNVCLYRKGYDSISRYTYAFGCSVPLEYVYFSLANNNGSFYYYGTNTLVSGTSNIKIEVDTNTNLAFIDVAWNNTYNLPFIINARGEYNDNIVTTISTLTQYPLPTIEYVPITITLPSTSGYNINFIGKCKVDLKEYKMSGLTDRYYIKIYSQQSFDINSMGSYYLLYEDYIDTILLTNDYYEYSETLNLGSNAKMYKRYKYEIYKCNVGDCSPDSNHCWITNETSIYTIENTLCPSTLELGSLTMSANGCPVTIPLSGSFNTEGYICNTSMYYLNQFYHSIT